MLQSILRYKPFYTYASIGAFLVFLGTIPFIRFLYYWSEGRGEGHLQSLAAGIILAIIGGQLVVVGLLAKAIAWNRQLMEDMLYRMRYDAALTASQDIISLPREETLVMAPQLDGAEPAVRVG